MAFQNPYADRLPEFGSFVLNEPDVHRHYQPEGGGWDAFFRSRMGANPERTVLEIGCSNAEFLTSIAARHPRTAFIGIDWKFKIIYKGARRIEREGLKNVALLRTKAQELARIFGSAELDEIWVFFPDPRAKKPQLKHRLIQESFLLEAARALRAKGRVFIKTDHPGYFQWMLRLFGQPAPELPEYDPRDPGERSYRARQVKVRRLEDEDLMPPVSERARAALTLDFFTIDYWKEGATRPPTLFSETQTLFEKTFVSERLPIYYLELTKK